jgi:hypothetical protein
MRSNRYLLTPHAWPTLDELEEFQYAIAAPAGTFKYFGLGDQWQHGEDPALSSQPRATFGKIAAMLEAAGE